MPSGMPLPLVDTPHSLWPITEAGGCRASSAVTPGTPLWSGVSGGSPDCRDWVTMSRQRKACPGQGRSYTGAPSLGSATPTPPQPTAGLDPLGGTAVLRMGAGGKALPRSWGEGASSPRARPPERREGRVVHLPPCPGSGTQAGPRGTWLGLGRRGMLPWHQS